MKKILFILFAFISSLAYSQINKLDIGVIGGPALSTLYFMSDGKVAARGSAGVFIQYTFNKYLAFSGDILYSQTGGNVLGGNVPGYPYTFAYHLNYLTVPVLLKFGGGNKVHIYGLAGPYLGVFLNGMDKANYHSATIPEKTFPLYYRMPDGGICLGVGLSYSFTKKFAFVCEIRNNVGLVNINSGQNAGQLNDVIRNFSSSLILGVSYKFAKQEKKSKK